MKSQYKLTLWRYLIVLVVLLITQVLFYLLNTQLFNVDSFNAFWRICVGNIRFALSSLSFYLAPFLFLALLPSPLQNNKIYRIITTIFYFLGLEVIMIMNLIDCGYYCFTFKRITCDIFNYLGVGGDFGTLIPTFLHDYWHIVTIFIVLNVLLFYLDSRLRKRYFKKAEKDKTNYVANRAKILFWAKHSIVFLVLVFVLVIFQRGGLQKRPISPIGASFYASTQNTALVLNTPFTFYRTIGKPALTIKEYYTEDQLKKIYIPISYPSQNVWTDSLFTEIPSVGKTNVYIIIVESFSAEYTGAYNHTSKTYTPFIDSLAKHSIVFQGMSNGRKSIDGIPAVVSSMPLLGEAPYITSPYGQNNLASIASILKRHGYENAFYHGTYNGVMNFDGFGKKVGFDVYYGMNEYGNNKDYDGNWGIFDEEFLQYTAKGVNKMKQPFTVTSFTTSNHSPYTIPKKHIGRFPKGPVPYDETIGYTDYALRRFFDAIKDQPWFKNTIFVITGDHSALNADDNFKTPLGLYRIPMIVYSPMLKHGVVSNQVMQQIDVLPTINDMIHNNEPIFAYGRSVFSNQEHFYIYYSNSEYLVWIGDFVSKYREGYPTQLFNVKKDPMLTTNIATKYPDKTKYHEQLTKAIIQQYNNRLIKNKTLVTDK